MDWRVIVEKDPDTGDYAVWCPELPGCASCGEDEADARKNIREAIALYLEPHPVELRNGAVERNVAL